MKVTWDNALAVVGIIGIALFLYHPVKSAISIWLVKEQAKKWAEEKIDQVFQKRG